MTATLARHPVGWALATSFVTLMVGAILIVLGDLGCPPWVMILGGAVLWTVGLPTTLAVVLAASAWGVVPGLVTNSLAPFLLFSSILGSSAQVCSFWLLARLLRSRTRRL
jgi:hypothetical protein